MTRTQYVSKMQCILDDKSKFERLGPCSEFDQTHLIEDHIQAYLKELRGSKEISKDAYADMVPSGSTRPRMYGLPKVHKEGVPLRPILSMIGSPQHALAKWLCGLLKPVEKFYTHRCVKDSFAFANLVKAATLTPGGYMCTFDVVSLFTKVPLGEVIDICADALFRNDRIETEMITLKEESFRKLMQFATSGVQFSFDNNMYRQTDGVAMGSPLGPALANIFVGFYERQIGRRSWPDMYARFVDDVFSHFPNKSFCDRFYERLNSLHPALRFTREEEQEGSLPFMDVKVIRTTNGMATSIYRKPTFTGLYTPWDSYSPTLYKVNLARSLCHRARRICSPAYLSAELQALRSILLNNGYPGHVLDKHITPLPRSNATAFIGPRPCPVILQLPWIGHKSELFHQKANAAVRIAYFSVKVRTVFKTSKMFSLPKDVLPTLSNSNVVYLYECRHCESRYVGRTLQRLEDRVKQHVPRHLLNPTDGTEKKRGPGRPPKERKSADEYQSAIACHLAADALCRARYSDLDFRILARARSEQHLKVLEALYIQSLKPVLCRQKQFVTDLKLFHRPRT